MKYGGLASAVNDTGEVGATDNVSAGGSRRSMCACRVSPTPSVKCRTRDSYRNVV